MFRLCLIALLSLLLAFGTWAIVLYKRACKNAMLEGVQRAHFTYFLESQDPTTGLTLDRSTSNSPASIAAVGFALTAYPVAVDRGWISREEAAAYTLKVLHTLYDAPQGPEPAGCSGYNGYFYHMLDPHTGTRATAAAGFWDSELSSVDTALLMSGVLFAKGYYSNDCAKENEIRTLADQLYRRVNWAWLEDSDGLIRLAWTPEHGMHPQSYRGYNEAMILYLLAIGSPTHPVDATSWNKYIRHETVKQFYGVSYVHMLGAPLFGYQYPQMYIDFRGIYDDLNQEIGFDYFENSRKATLAQYKYAIANPKRFAGYSDELWGLTACDGPSDGVKTIDGRDIQFRRYSERGAPGGFDDGTIAPTAAISAMPFAPELVVPTLNTWLQMRPELLGRNGFVDAFNPTFDQSSPSGWLGEQRVGIDQGPIIVMIENYRSELVWDVMRNDAYLRAGLIRAGFAGGWLDEQ